MYLKSIEIQGFKSFANKTVLEFHNGITAIVGPNGSGKSNISDAVRWVFGEQSAKSLRGNSMQDVIFSGTETRRALGNASVSVTLDNSDHLLQVPYDEITLTRRVYRSGESEYLLNGTQMRLKDISELFYDTGIGKEGYSIIGQGQIDKILSGKPEDRRELFDEAAGIVRYRRRRQTAAKKLDDERQNMARINDILAEQAKQLGPLKKQAETARIYLQKREDLKINDVNLFLLDMAKIRQDLDTITQNRQIAQEQLSRAKEEYERTKAEYDADEKEIEELDEQLLEKRNRSSAAILKKSEYENQINLLKEQIRTAKNTDEMLRSRKEEISVRISDCDSQQNQALDELCELKKNMENAGSDSASRQQILEDISGDISKTEQDISQAKSAIISLLNQRATVKAEMQRYDTMSEQAQIRRSEISQEIIRLKTEESSMESDISDAQKEYNEINTEIDELTAKSEAVNNQLSAVSSELAGLNQQMETDRARYQSEFSRLESLKNIAERYDGYGNSIRRIMERKDEEPGILGVVADIIKVEKKYETAIETALGGNIQNIVTDSEETAKRQIEFLKNNRFGRATFLPLDGITLRGNFSSPAALREEGVIGLASDLAETDKKYHILAESLLNRTIVCDNIDHAVSIAKKYKHSLRIVTLDGELLSPGGSISGGAYKNSGNLLGRRRDIEELEAHVQKSRSALDELLSKIDLTRNKRSSLRDELVRLNDELQHGYLAQNTAKLRLEDLNKKKTSNSDDFTRLTDESRDIEIQISEINECLAKEKGELDRSESDEKKYEEQVGSQQEKLDLLRENEKKALSDAQHAQMLLSRLEQQEQFINQNLSRIKDERKRLLQEEKKYEDQAESAMADIYEKEEEIKSFNDLLIENGENEKQLQMEIEELSLRKEETSASHKAFFDAREGLSDQISLLDKECFRLNAQADKLTEQKDDRINYIWEEYGLTNSTAAELRDETFTSASSLKKKIGEIKSEIKALGNVNVNAIEDYKDLFERSSFLTAQHDDLLKAEDSLVKIIDELDEGMRTQFKEQFARISNEFDRVFKQLFGGGRGTLELVDNEDILEAGISITAQPPGKKLQNMMQLSGGEKALTAIALLFAIQNLKPSPFCMLDEIEAALDESNVERFANYLRRLSGNTQFIIITHRRGAMNAADRLYGITMQEKGISALVSVNLIENELDD